MRGGFSSGKERGSYDYRILSDYPGESLAIVTEMLRNPTFPDDEIEVFVIARPAAETEVSRIKLNPFAMPPVG